MTIKHLAVAIGANAILNPTLLLCSAVLCFFLYRYGRFFFKRLMLWLKLKKICKKNGWQLSGRRSLFGRRNFSQCDFYVVTRKTVFAVKLFGVAGRRSKLFFREDGTYRIRSRWIPDTEPKQVPNYNFRAGYRYEWELKTPRKILLLNPVCTGVFRERKNEKPQPINPHEQILGMEVHTKTSFLNTIGDE